jgi:hypothetical protein
VADDQAAIDTLSPSLHRKRRMAVVTTLDIAGLTAEEYGRILDRIGVEKRPADDGRTL